MISVRPGWRPPPASLDIDVGDVHVWAAGVAGPDLDSLASRILSADERRRAARLQSPLRRREFTGGRALLRMLLAAYTGMSAESIPIVYGRFGKPALPDSEGAGELTFNMSCSHGLALYAFGRERHVGVDVERLQPGFPCAEIAQRYFCPAERARLSQLRGARLTQTFFRYWTAKEAVLKARGEGLRAGLHDPAVNELDDTRVAVIADRSSRVWAVTQLAPTPGYAGAVAIEGTDAVLCCWGLTFGGLSLWTTGSLGAGAVHS
jgi:4'-phosphopantetheinyl transferase